MIPFWQEPTSEPNARAVELLGKLSFSRPLWEHQRQAVLRFCGKKEVALLHEMGTGKTTTLITLLRLFYAEQRSVQNTLIVTPKATIQNWKDEFVRNSARPVHEKVVPLVDMSGKEKVDEIRNGRGCIYILNPESFDGRSTGVVDALKFFKPKALVVDESQRFKNPGSSRFEKLLYFADRSIFCAILTGTPILNSPLDLWAQYRILDGGVTLGGNFYGFRERYFEDKNAEWKGKPQYFPNWQPRENTAEELSAKISLKSSRVLKKDCLTLPPQIITRREFTMGKEQQKAYDDMFDELIAEIDQGICTAANALSKTLRCLQIASGFMTTEDGTDHFFKSEREQILSELLDDLCKNHKVIVWAVYKPNYAVIENLFKEKRIEYARLYGGVKDVAGEIRRFQEDPSCRGIVANPAAGGVGVTLTASAYSIYYTRNFSLGDRLQSLARNHRGGSEQHDKITAIDLVAKNTVDVDVLNALDRKEEFSDRILERLKNVRTS